MKREARRGLLELTRDYPGGGKVAVEATWVNVGALVGGRRGSGPPGVH